MLKSLFLFPTCVLGFEYVPLLAWLKSHCWFANQVKGKFETHLGEFIVFVWCSGKGCWSYIGVRLRLNPLCRRGSHVLEPILGSVNYEAAWRQFLVYKNYGMARQTPCHLQNPVSRESRQKQLKVLLIAKFFVSRCEFCKLQRNFGFFCSINHLSGPLRKHMFTCDLCISTHFVCFCVSRFVACDRPVSGNSPLNFFEDFSDLSYSCLLQE